MNKKNKGPSKTWVMWQGMLATIRRRDKLMEIAKLIVQNSGGRARLAFQEKDETTNKKVEDVGHFIKVDEKRFGRDIQTYGSTMGKEHIDWEFTMLLFLKEIFLPLRDIGLMESYEAAAEQLKGLGHDVYPDYVHADWDEFINSGIIPEFISKGIS